MHIPPLKHVNDELHELLTTDKLIESSFCLSFGIEQFEHFGPLHPLGQIQMYKMSSSSEETHVAPF